MKRLSCMLALAVLLTGCKDPYGACVKADSDIAQGISSGFATVTQLEKAGTISSSEALNVAGYLEFANQADEAFGTCAQAAHTAGSKAGAFTACANILNTALNNPSQLALIHVGNSSASTTINTIVNGLTTGVNSVIAGLGGA